METKRITLVNFNDLPETPLDVDLNNLIDDVRERVNRVCADISGDFGINDADEYDDIRERFVLSIVRRICGDTAYSYDVTS